MSNKVTCPHCNAHLSSIYRAALNGDPCPNCGGELGLAETGRAVELHGIQWEVREPSPQPQASIVEFLEARIAEDEAAAKKAAKFRYNRPSDAPWERARMDIEMGVPSSSSALHALFDPARVLRECAAKRTIINVADSAGSEVAALAAVYADHPDYDPELAW